MYMDDVNKLSDDIYDLIEARLNKFDIHIDDVSTILIQETIDNLLGKLADYPDYNNYN